jgi:deoxycytidine triphosphate deaminase
VPVKTRIDQLALHQIDLSKGAVFEAGCVYIVPLLESVALPSRMSGIANPKSSTGRLDVFTRLITDGAKEFDRVEPGYGGPLYAEVSPRSFSILVREGSRLNQLRLRRGSPSFSDADLRKLQAEQGIVAGDADISDGIALTVDLRGAGWSELIGYRAKRHAAQLMAHDGFAGAGDEETRFEMSLHFRFTEAPFDEHQVRPPGRRAVAGCIGKDVRGVRVPIHAFEGGGTLMDGHVAAQRSLVSRVMVSGKVMSVMFGQREIDSFTMLPAMNAMLAGRSARRRMRYGYH